VVNAGQDVTVDPGEQVAIRSSGTDYDGWLSYWSWSQVSGTPVEFLPGNLVGLQFRAPATGGHTLVFRLTVRDNERNTAYDEVTVTVRAVPLTPAPNAGPALEVGPDLVVDQGEHVTIVASASDPDGSVVSYVWEQIDGASVALTGADTATLQFDAPARSREQLTFRLEVKDDRGATNAADVTVWVDPGDPVDPIAIPDPGFRQCVQNMGAEYVFQVYSLDCYGGQISSITGIEQFASLTQLALRDIPLTSADLSGLPNLAHLYINDTELASVNLAANTRLREVAIYRNRLTSIDVSALTELEYLDLGDNELTTLDLSSNANLRDLAAPDNQLTSINLPASAPIRWVYVSNNQLTSLVLPEGSGVVIIDASHNRLTTVDVSGAMDLDTLYLQDNQLTSLDLTASRRMRTLEVQQNLLTQILFPEESALEWLIASSNALTTIDLSSLTQLGNLKLADNDLAAVDLSNNSRLGTLDLSDNRLTELDLSGNPELNGLVANRNQLTSIDLSGNNNLQRLELEDNLLTEIDLPVLRRSFAVGAPAGFEVSVDRL